ncbi:N-acetylornithine carbamoyltransferase [Flammeovirgaceae bacterium SG7u.111]|nr:N-acetylornithine carbamoyltransferase [Flammeovirgaceae bacterium SG7u.132]WPO38571.1 N-acetylornithine carbamoyltransferase [Flammeovirgaceae bacterium SG7u.111]
MKNFTGLSDVDDLYGLVKEGIALKKDPFGYKKLGEGLTMGIIFLNPSLRTRLSTQKAAQNLGMSPIVMNFGSEGWQLEFEDGVVMDGNKAEHVKDAARVMGAYFDVMGIRSFPGLKDREADYAETIIEQFKQHCGIPLISLESATRHPLQSLADLMTIEEHKKVAKPKVVLTWAPHPKVLPQAVPNSFAEWMNAADVDFVITHPEGYELAEEFAGNAKVTHNQAEAFEEADFIYAKNWSSYKEYGKVLCEDKSWIVDGAKMALTNEAGFMHCLPVRRNVIVSDEVIDSPNSLIIQEAANREYAAQVVLKRILEANF